MPDSERCNVSPHVAERIEQWWSDLQKERRCNSTSVISKLVNKTSLEEQDNVRELISKHIKKGIENSIQSKEITGIYTLCNAINGCFDNFVHAADAANISFSEIIYFIDVCIDECTNKLFIKQTSKCNTVKVLELLHCLSRILVLILKLRRPLKCCSKPQALTETDHDAKVLLSRLSYKVSCFLKVDDILMDTKYNFVMSSLLIREIIVQDREKLMQYHQNFLATLPKVIEEKEYKLNILKFLLSNGVLNTWTNIVIDASSTRAYLHFFIKLCESYSSDTAIILNISRALLLLVKNECFKDFVMTLEDKDSHLVNSLLTCIWMLLDHPVACVRHSSKDFLQLLAAYEHYRSEMLNSLSRLSCDKRSYFITLAALANESGSRSLLKLDRSLPKNLVLAVYDPTLVTHVIYALESLIVKDSLVDENFSEWCETWIIPLLVSLSKVPLVVAADIEKLLDGLFRRYPSAIFYIINKWLEPNNDEELRYIITALKIYHRHGFKPQTNAVHAENSEEPCSKVKEKKWKNLISEKLLRFCLHHNDDDIRVSAFALIIQSHKSTEVYTEQDFTLIQYFLTYNLNNQHPATRQKILSLITKMLTRFADSLTVIKRTLKSAPSRTSDDLSNYGKFQDWLIEFCFANIFDGANFNRLNTVLSILLSCFDNMENIVPESRVAVCWKKLLVALRSSYEENKMMAVSLAKKLNICKLVSESDSTVELLFARACELCGKIEPPNVLTGSYLMQLLIEFSSIKKVAGGFLGVGETEDDGRLLCIEVLMSRLRKQVESAEKNLIKAAVTGPMYGLLLAVRLIIQGIDFKEINQKGMSANGESDEKPSKAIQKWTRIIDELIGLSFRMIHVVSCVVNSSSPEGHLPSDFQSDFEFIFNEETLSVLSRDMDERDEGSNDVLPDRQIGSLEQQVENLKLSDPLRTKEEVMLDCERLIRRFNRIFLSINNCSSLSQKNVADLTALLDNCSRLLSENNRDETSTHSRCLHSIQKKLKKCLKIYKSSRCGDGRPTAQVLLLCAWRSIKEACLFLGGLLSKLPLEETLELQLITEDRVMAIGQELRTLLCEIKHRGAFEQAYIGFNQLISALWKCPRKNLSEFPSKWLQEILEEIKLPLEKQRMRLCSSRRSAGLPFLVQGIISSELQYTKSAKIQTLETTMKTLLDIVENEEDDSVTLECKIHSLNVLRALFKHAMLGEHVAPYVSRALMVAVRGSRASAWSIRNSCNLLFSSLVIRIFGVARNKDALSKKNRMTSRTFFQRYPELYEFFLSEMKLAFQSDRPAHEYHPQPNVFHVLLILGRLYPPPTEDPVNIDFSEFLPLIKISCRNPTLKIRELGARALVPLISQEKFKKELDESFGLLRADCSGADSNQRQGVLLQLKTILTEMSCDQSKLIKESLEEKGSTWIQNTKWILEGTNEEDRQTPYFISTSYLHVLHIMFKACPSLRQDVTDVVNRTESVPDGDSLSDAAIPGRFVFLETLHFVRFDMAAHEFLISGNGEELIRLFLTMLKSPVDEVQSIPLRFFHYVTSQNGEEAEEEDVNSIAVRIQDLSSIQTDTNLKALKQAILSHSQVLQYFVKRIVSFLLNVHVSSLFVHKVIARLWLSVISTFLLQDVVSVKQIYDACESECQTSSSLLDSLLYLVDCEDSDISMSAFICYATIFLEDVTRGAELTPDSISHFTKLMLGFSDPDADVGQRAAVADVFNRYYCLFNHRFFLEDNQALSIWMLPLRLIADDDPFVRKSAIKLVSKYQISLRDDSHHKLIQFEDVSLSQLTTVPPKAQEYLLDCYISLSGEKDLFHLVVQMVAWCLSAYVNTINFENMTKQNEAGVFEKGNPNPFCEELAFAVLIGSKLEQLKQLTDLKSLFRKELDATHVNSLQIFFPTLTLPKFPQTLSELGGEIIEILTEEDPELDKRTVSLLPFYISDLKKIFNFH